MTGADRGSTEPWPFRSDAVKRRIVAEVNKGLTTHLVYEIELHLMASA
jgi:hypothetical protein